MRSSRVGVSEYADPEIRRDARKMSIENQVRYHWQSNPDRAISLVQTRVSIIAKQLRTYLGPDAAICQHPLTQAFTIPTLREKAECFVERLKKCLPKLQKKMGEKIHAFLYKVDRLIYMLNLDIATPTVS